MSTYVDIVGHNRTIAWIYWTDLLRMSCKTNMLSVVGQVIRPSQVYPGGPIEGPKHVRDDVCIRGTHFPRKQRRVVHTVDGCEDPREVAGDPGADPGTQPTDP